MRGIVCCPTLHSANGTNGIHDSAASLYNATTILLHRKPYNQSRVYPTFPSTYLLRCSYNRHPMHPYRPLLPILPLHILRQFRYRHRPHFSPFLLAPEFLQDERDHHGEGVDELRWGGECEVFADGVDGDVGPHSLVLGCFLLGEMLADPVGGMPVPLISAPGAVHG